jgi:mannitol/fructose-specific phosphotransferase system IIA component (Ntr-type)
MHFPGGDVEDSEGFADLLRRREAVESTAVGKGVALPHVRGDMVKTLRMAFARSGEGVPFDAADGEPVRLFFVLASPSESHGKYLQAVAKVARLLRSEVIRSALMEAPTPARLLSIIEDFDRLMPERLEVRVKEGRVIHQER